MHRFLASWVFVNRKNFIRFYNTENHPGLKKGNSLHELNFVLCYQCNEYHHEQLIQSHHVVLWSLSLWLVHKCYILDYMLLKVSSIIFFYDFIFSIERRYLVERKPDFI